MPVITRSSRRSAQHARLLSVLAFSLLGMSQTQTLQAFDFNDVSDMAQELAQKGYTGPGTNLPSALSSLDYSHYKEIVFKDQYSLWRGENLPFDLGFAHEGMVYDTPVNINEVVGDDVRPLQYSPDQFTYGNNALKPDDFKSLGYAGFWINYGADTDQRYQVMTFLGASYFKAVGKGQRYGVSGRGIAIDTGLAAGEEFPRFKTFWVVKPNQGDRYLIIYALLDSPSTTGAYRFVLRPGEDTLVDVQSRLFMRHGVSKMGIAPLSSMFYYGAVQPGSRDNFRPEMHSSEGLLVRDDQDDWTWQPLINPRRLSINSYEMPRIRGFGLMQRNHDFDAYQDIDDRYDLRPSVWVEPTNAWGAGKLELIQIPSPNETNENVIALWQPQTPPAVGQRYDYNYRMTFTANESRLRLQPLAWVDQTRRGEGEVKQSNTLRKSDGSLAYIIDFRGDNLKSLPSNEVVSVSVDAGDNADVVGVDVKRQPVIDGYRVTLRVKVKDVNKPTDLKAFIKDGEGHRLSETWRMLKPMDV